METFSRDELTVAPNSFSRLQKEHSEMVNRVQKVIKKIPQSLTHAGERDQKKSSGTWTDANATVGTHNIEYLTHLKTFCQSEGRSCHSDVTSEIIYDNCHFEVKYELWCILYKLRQLQIH